MQRLHDSIQALYTKNKKSEEEYRRVCQQVYDLKSKYEPHEYEKELKEKEPSVMEYLIKCKNKLNEFQDKLIYNSEEISRFVNTVDKIYNQDHIKIAQLQKNSESSNVIAQRVVDFYRGYLSTYSLELSKVIIRKGGKKSEGKSLSTCCRCSTIIKSENTKTCHSNCIACDYVMLFVCSNMKQVSQLPNSES
jgi:hypothetical protein